MNQTKPNELDLMLEPIETLHNLLQWSNPCWFVWAMSIAIQRQDVRDWIAGSSGVGPSWLTSVKRAARRAGYVIRMVPGKHNHIAKVERRKSK